VHDRVADLRKLCRISVVDGVERRLARPGR
jgi:hypothetical protein